MTHIDSVILDATDPDAADAFYRAAFGLDTRLQVRTAEEQPATGFRGFVLSLVVAQPSTVDLLVGAALKEGATAIKPVTKSLWGYGGVVRAPDGSIWKVATSSKRNSGPAAREIDDVVLLLGADDVKASKRFYADQGLTVKRSFGGKYVEFDAPDGSIKLALYGRRALAKDAGMAPDGDGPRRIVIAGSAGAEALADPDGFTWAPAGAPQLV